ncbi:uncharacterized protein LOC106721244 [Papilio machaon]|uniref:uncharacterized protein LOC106721244 n=2 Tax=Papilio machaon TaxID=76193 RepID=UPI001E663C23|nr:uncharacterized protein LOC106721244 [Papilio machaon]
MSIEWDDPLPINVITEWSIYRNDLIKLQGIKIDRWINTYQIRTNVELHGFADASTAAYAAVVYVKALDDDGNPKITLLESKTKVAPLKQISVARLELCGALLLAKMLYQAAIHLKIPMGQVFAYTDSTVTLAWIEGQPIKWQTFVANRVTEIQTLLDNSAWRFVSSRDNPADLASRGIQADDLVASSLWWQGPTWLKETHKYKQTNASYTTTLEERKQRVKTFLCELEEKPIYERFSTLNRMKRVLTYCRRFLLLKPEKQYTDYLSTKELNETMQMCIKLCQRQDFMEEIRDLKESGMVKKRSKLKTLSPYLDENQILRVGGRLQGATIGSEIKHPILLPKHNHLTTLVVRDAHIKLLHGGNRLMTNFLQNQYWIIGLKPLVKKCVRECVVCVRHKGMVLQPKMGELPSVRITPGRPFKTSGVDFAGPIQLRTSKGRGHKAFKGYICLFICMKTKAVHLEVVSDLTSKGFIAAFKRFISRRGHCSDVWSDNGLNFVGAAKELKDNANIRCSSGMKDIVELLANEGTIWHFIPPRAPNFGGLWEAAVKSAKTHLVKVVGNSTLTFEEMTTLLSQVEACLNSRPICQLNDNPDDLFPLTPAHFLIGEATMIIPEPDHENTRLSALDRWTLVQKMTQHFWKRWSTEYLQGLQRRQKWQKSSISPDVGQLVIIKENDLPPAKWLLARILELIPGPDKAVRVVKLKCKSSILTRPINKIILLPRDIKLHEDAHEYLMVGGKNKVLGGRNVGAVSATAQ